MPATARTAERLVIGPSPRARASIVTISVTPLRELPKRSDLKANSPLDALVTFCDRHGWHTDSFEHISDPVVPIRGAIRASDRTTARVLVSPVSTVRSLTKDGTPKHEGMYSVEVVR